MIGAELVEPVTGFFTPSLDFELFVAGPGVGFDLGAAVVLITGFRTDEVDEAGLLVLPVEPAIGALILAVAFVVPPVL